MRKIDLAAKAISNFPEASENEMKKKKRCESVA